MRGELLTQAKDDKSWSISIICQQTKPTPATQTTQQKTNKERTTRAKERSFRDFKRGSFIELMAQPSQKGSWFQEEDSLKLKRRKNE